MEVTTTADKVLDAAKASTETKDVLKHLFPDVFGPEWVINGVYKHNSSGVHFKFCNVNRCIVKSDERYQLIKVRGSGNYYSNPMPYSAFSQHDLKHFIYLGMAHEVVQIKGVIYA